MKETKSSKFLQAIAAANLLIGSQVALASTSTQKEDTEPGIYMESEEDAGTLQNSNSGCGNSGCNSGCKK